ncbi:MULTISPECIES: ankyrin repeat domain-containing protein [unclassified Wolbachia]|uniref:ankyrin repeat domain-containing protein n=1 Tax=unclassified Wolbachia TaxID=2640676 RepID=UPI002227FEAB|nr:MULTISPECIES: ankyrin repeat domain-containing protein [unclassified Wolbachia]
MPETYPAWGRKRSLHGDIYQLKWVMLLLKRAVDVGYSFRLATEMESATGFDDIVFQDRKNEKIVHRFIQNKHKQNECEKIGVGKLLSKNKSGEFSVPKYFVSYLKIKINPDFADGDLKDFTICTNIGFDLAQSTTQNTIKKLKAKTSGPNKGIEIAVEVISTSDIFFKYGGTRYKFSCTHDNMISIVQPAFKSAVKEAIEELEKEIKELQGKSDQNSKRKLERNQVWQREFERMTNEGKLEENIREFFDKLVFAVNQPNEIKLAEIIENELGKEFNNIDKKNVYGRFLVEVLDWMKAREGKFLSHEEINEFFEKIREEILGAVWFKIIEPVASFTGRSSELKALHNALQRSTGRQAVISQVATISGLGGVGKSELARKYAYKYGKYYGGNVIWINAENFEDMKNSFLRLAGDDRLGIPPKDKHGRDKTIEAIVEEIYAFFARRGRKSLFIFDNAEGYKGIKRFLPSSLHPRHKKPYVLITSRDCKWNVRGEGDIKVIQLDEFGEVEALEFVRKALNIENNLQDREIEELTRELQYFPLALGQAVVYIQDRNEESRLRGDKRFKISDYLKEYQQNAGELLKKGVYENEDRYTKTVLTTWNITMTYICKEYGFEALSILEIMAYLAPDNICIKEIFSKLITDDKAKLWNAVELLNRYSMIKLREGVVNIHRLVQKVTRLKLQEKGREEEVLRKALNLVNIGDVAKDNKIHVAFIWGYASKHGKLIDDFYKDTNLHLLVENGDYKAIKNLLAYIKRKHQNKLSGIVNAKNGCDIAPLHLAAGNGELDIAKHLINEGANIDARDCFYQTPLYWAAKSGELDMVKYLVNKGASVGIKDNYGWTVLYWAVESESFDIAEYLIKEKGMGIDVSAKYSNGKTMLHEAIRFAKLDAIKYLIDKGIDINIKNGYGDTPLHWAAIREKVDVVRYFVEQGADVNAKNNEGKTALDYVTDNQELVELLLTHDESVEVA